MPLTAKQVLEYSTALLAETQQTREDAERFEKVHGGYLLPRLPPDLARDEAVYVLAYDVMHEAREIKSRIMTFEEEIQCLPTSRTTSHTIPEQDKTAADKLERSGAIFLSRLDPNLRLKAAVTDRQLVEPLAIVVLELGAIDKAKPKERFPWRAFEVELDGCGWLEKDGTPTVFSRTYSDYVSSLKKEMANRRDVNMDALSDDFTERTRDSTTGSKMFERREMVWLDDGETIYIVAKRGTGATQTNQEGEILWSGPNPFGRVSAFLIGSNVRPARSMRDRYLPFLLDLIMTSENENVIESVRATASRNRANARQWMNADPEIMKLWQQQHPGENYPDLRWKPGEIPVFSGSLETETIEVDPDLDKLDQRIQERKMQYRSNTNSLTDPDVLKNATLGAQLAAWDAGAASLSIVVGPQDVWSKDMLNAWENSVRWLAKQNPEYAKFEFQATGGETISGGKSLKAGDAVSIDVGSFEVEHEWRVTTSQRTRGQAQSEYEAAMQRFNPTATGLPGIGIYEELFRAAGVSDVEERKTTLLRESLRAEVLDPLMRQWVEKVAAFKVDLETGIPADFLEGTMPPPESGPGPNGNTPAGNNGTQSPVTQPTEGGSAPALVGG